MRKILSESQLHLQANKTIENFYPEIIAEIETAIQKNEWVIIGMAQNAFVKKAKKILEEKNISFVYKEYGSYFSMWQKRLAIKLWSGWPTFPQVFHKGKLIGGYTDLIKYLSAS